MEVVFVDLDGTLLDLDDYSFTGSIEGIRILQSMGILIVPASGKTRAEIIEVMNDLGISGPFIYENGAGICFGENDTRPDEILSPPFEEITAALERLSLASGLKFRSIVEMTDEFTAEYTGLSVEQASLARKRIASLPFVITGEKNIDSRRAAEMNQSPALDGFTIIKGGKFYHLVPQTVDKGKAAAILVQHITVGHEKIFVTAAGDGENDLAMLEFAERKIYLGGPHEMKLPEGTHITAKTGPAGFTEAVKKFYLLQDE